MVRKQFPTFFISTVNITGPIKPGCPKDYDNMGAVRTWAVAETSCAAGAMTGRLMSSGSLRLAL